MTLRQLLWWVVLALLVGMALAIGREIGIELYREWFA